MTAQLFPLYPKETLTVRLELLRDGEWREVQRRQINDIGWSTLFRMENWDNTRDVSYRLRHGEQAEFKGLIRKDPVNKDEIVIGSLNCNSNQNRDPRTEIVNNLKHFDPDFLFFAGFQNKITMYSYANPDKKFRRGGFGLIRFNKKERTVTFESWD